MMKKKITIAIAILSVLGISSCTEDFITKDPLGVSSSATYYKDVDQCQLAVNAIYDPVGWQYLHDECMWKIGDICNDDAERGGGDALKTYTTGDDWDKSGQLAVFEASDRSSVMAYIWESAYIGIARANAMLAGTEGLTDKEFVTMRAEVRFLRALYYFDLVKVFGPVVLIKNTVSAAEAANLGNRAEGDDANGSKQVKAIYDFIISELDAAAKADLPVTADAFGKVTNGAARALLAKAYLYRADICNTGSADYELAYQTANALCNESTYFLEPHYQDLFDIYGETHEQSKEVIFSIQHIAGTKYDRDGDGSIIPLYIAPRYYWDTAGNVSQGESELGYGFAMPTQNLLDEFTDGDARASLIVASSHKNAAVNSTITRLNLDTAAWAKPTKISGGEGWYPIGATDWTTGYYNMKKGVLSTLLCNSGNNSQVAGKDNILLRLADVMLIAAEAGVQCGHSDVALSLIKKLRKRARNSARTIDYTKDGSSADCYTYAISAKPADPLTVDLDDVKAERRVEMYGEGERYWDLIRWNDVSKFRTEDIAGYSFKYNTATLGRWPIPQSEIILHTGGNLIQNPGY